MSKSAVISKVDGLILRESGPWIKKKHHYLTEYAKIFTIGMSKKWQNLTYIDLFAGPGRCIIKSAPDEFDGSPLLMLQHNFSHYIFVEEDRKIMQALQKRCESSPKHSHITFINADCHKTIEQVIEKIPYKSLSLAFIDPVDINIPFATLRSFSQTPYGIDLLINIQLGMDIKRNFELYKSQGDDSKLGSFLDGSVPWDQLRDTVDVIKLYKERIGKLGYSTVEYTDIPVHNTKKAEMYFLMFASKNPRGLHFWKQITRKDHLGQKELF
jgi:three-Cys-motif partner protein